MKGWLREEALEVVRLFFSKQVPNCLAEREMVGIGWFRGGGLDLQRMGVVKC